MCHNGIWGEQIAPYYSEQSLYSKIYNTLKFEIVILCLYCTCQCLVFNGLQEIGVMQTCTDTHTNRHANWQPYPFSTCALRHNQFTRFSSSFICVAEDIAFNLCLKVWDSSYIIACMCCNSAIWLVNCLDIIHFWSTWSSGHPWKILRQYLEAIHIVRPRYTNVDANPTVSGSQKHSSYYYSEDK